MKEKLKSLSLRAAKEESSAYESPHEKEIPRIPYLQLLRSIVFWGEPNVNFFCQKQPTDFPTTGRLPLSTEYKLRPLIRKSIHSLATRQEQLKRNYKLVYPNFPKYLRSLTHIPYSLRNLTKFHIAGSNRLLLSDQQQQTIEPKPPEFEHPTITPTRSIHYAKTQQQSHIADSPHNSS